MTNFKQIHGQSGIDISNTLFTCSDARQHSAVCCNICTKAAHMGSLSPPQASTLPSANRVAWSRKRDGACSAVVLAQLLGGENSAAPGGAASRPATDSAACTFRHEASLRLGVE
jgi:hypothetical protein